MVGGVIKSGGDFNYCPASSFRCNNYRICVLELLHLIRISDATVNSDVMTQIILAENFSLILYITNKRSLCHSSYLKNVLQLPSPLFTRPPKSIPLFFSSSPHLSHFLLDKTRPNNHQPKSQAPQRFHPGTFSSLWRSVYLSCFTFYFFFASFRLSIPRLVNP